MYPLRLLSVAVVSALLVSSCGGMSRSEFLKSDPVSPPCGSSNCAGTGVGVKPDFQPPPGHDLWFESQKTMGLDVRNRPAEGKGVTVGLVTAGIDFKYTPLAGNEGAKLPEVVARTGIPSLFDKDVGTATATVIAGSPWGSFQGGVAPGAKLVWTSRQNRESVAALMEAGIDILHLGHAKMNASYIGDNSDDFEKQKNLNDGTYQLFYNFQDKQKGIVIHASGYNSPWISQPLSDASIPYYFPDIKNWITVAALKEDKSGLQDWSAPCGKMAERCLVAPSVWRLVWPTSGKPADFSYRWVDPAMSSAAVAGAAALVKQLYPWMTGVQVADTLLSTTTDLGTSGTDDTYGRGLLNVANAVKGPGTVTGAWVADVSEGWSGSFSNDIAGTGSLVKKGQGTLSLTGNNTYTGGTQIDAGTLMAKSLTGDVTQNGGTLGLSGMTLSRLTQNAGTLQLESGQTVHVGNAQLNGALSIAPGKDFSGQYNGAVLTAENLSGTWTNAPAGSLFYTSALTQDGNSLWGKVSRTSGAVSLAQQGVTDASRLRTAGNIDSFLKASDSFQGEKSLAHQDILAQANALQATDQSLLTLDSLSGQALATVRGAALSTARGQQQWITERARASRGTDGGVWVMAGHQQNHVSSASHFAYDVDSTSFAAGMDIASANGKATLGAALQKGDTRSQFDRLGGKIRTDQAGVTLYASATPSDQWSFTASLGASNLRHSANRSIATDGFHGALAETHGRILSGQLQAERKLTDNISLTGALAHDEVKTKAFEEEGTSGFELVADSSTAKNSRAGVGVLFHDGKPVAQVGWKYEGEVLYMRSFGSADNGFDARYKSAPTGWFRVEGMDLGGNTTLARGSVGYRLPSKSMVSLGLGFLKHKYGNDTNVNIVWRQNF